MPGPWRAGNKFDRGERAPGTLGPSTAHTMVGVDRLRNLRDLAQTALDDNIPGDFIETGVWRGGCCILMRGILAANGVRERKVYVADSFKGVPPPQPELYPADRGDTLYRHSELAVPLDTVKANFDRYGLLDDQVVFVEGLFSDTLPSLRCGSFALIRLDGDLYESTILALQHLHPKLSAGRLCDHRRFRCRSGMPAGRDRLQSATADRRSDSSGRPQRRMVAQAGWCNRVDPACGP